MRARCELRARLIIVQSGQHSSGLLLRSAGLLGALGANARRALLDADAVLPRVDAVALWCDQSVWICVQGTQALRDLAGEEPAPGRRKRRVSFRKLENANHFVSARVCDGGSVADELTRFTGTSLSDLFAS